jgi:NADPH:quinone reductase
MPTMKAVLLRHKGDPAGLAYEDVPVPEVPPGHVLVRVEAAGVNFADVVRRGSEGYPIPTPLPYTLGTEFAGTVARTGDPVERPAVGDRVFGLVDPVTSGCYAQYVVVPAMAAFPLPDWLDPADSTALLVQGLTAYLALRDGVRLTAGESVLVLGAAGGLGSLAVQLARGMGAGTVVGAAGSAEKLTLVGELGADHAVNYSEPGWAERVVAATGGRGVDTALLAGDREVIGAALGAVAPFGRIRLLGANDPGALVVDFMAEIAAGRLAANQTVGFFTLTHYASPAMWPEVGVAMGALLEQVHSRTLRPVVRHRFGLADAAQAHRQIENRATTGKVVLIP